MIRAVAILVVLCALSGCAGTGWNMDWFGSKAKPESTKNIDEEAIRTLAEQAAKRLATHYPPGRTTLYMEPEKTPFLQTFEDNLRSHGFLFNATKGGKNALNLYARLDAIQGDETKQWYLYVRLSDGFSFGNLFALNEQGHFVPVGVLSQTPAFSDWLTMAPAPPIPSPPKARNGESVPATSSLK